MGKRQGKKAWIGKQVRAIFQGCEMAIADFALWAILADESWLSEAAARALDADKAGIFPWEDSPPPEKRFAVENGVAIVPIDGMITHGLSDFEKWLLGATDTDEIAEAVEDAAQADGVQAIVLSFNSPGGMVCGVPEAAARIAEVAGRVPVLAHTSSLMCSAAYWLASPSAAIYATGSATVGSIGCYTVHKDLSRHYENDGIGVRVFRSGDQKAAGVNSTALTDEQAEVIAARIAAIGGEFRAFVARGRGELSAEAVDGRAVSGADGERLGLVDSLGGLADAIADARMLAEIRKNAMENNEGA